ncbi:methyltransferase [Devosia sp.]|uniref:tRNA1(Val) (adenine(37)-N6)-methyltransferase n=1 Tax=Devosia sp. TaxID=1871048 RepID=UPI0032645357
MTQPRTGFRAGLDSVLLGASINPHSLDLLDLGAGVGTASLVALTHNPQARAVLLDHNADMGTLAEENAATAGMTGRMTFIALDVLAKGAERKAAGLATDHFTSVIANPPFFDDAAGTLAADAGRATARHMSAQALDLWVKTAAASAAPGGEIIFIYPVQSLSPLLAAFEQRFGAITIMPLSPRPDEPASRILIRAIKGSRAPLTMLASRALHGAEGRSFAPQFDAIFRGEARLGW